MIILKEKMKGIHLRGVLILIFLILIIIPFLVLTGVYLRVSQNYAKKSYGNYMVQVLEEIQKQTDETSKRYVDGTMNFYHNGLVDLLSESQISEGKEQEIQKKLKDILNSYSGSVSSIFMEYAGREYFSGIKYQDVLELMNSHQQELIQNKGRHIWYGPYQLLPKKKSGEKMILAKSLNGDRQKNIARVYLVIDLEEFSDAFEQEGLADIPQMLFAQNGNLIYSSHMKELINEIPQEKLLSSVQNGYDVMRINGSRYLTAYKTSKKTGWTGLLCIPMQMLLKGFMPVQIMLVVLAGIYLLFLFGMLFLLEKYIVIPIRSLTDCMDSFADGKFKMAADINAIGELNRLNRHFNQMTVRILDLMKQNETEVREKNEFKMQTLRAQLSPHFMYNSLNTIKWMAVINNQDNIKNLTDALIQLLMSHTRGKEEDYTLEDEIILIQNYATIQKARFMNFDIEIKIEEDVRKCRITKFLIQPIVENAIIHGFARGKKRRGVIRIRAYKNQVLFIQVEDNGIGFDVEQMREEKESKEKELAEKEHTHVAIKNIEQIIRLEYGEEFGIEIFSIQGEGTKVVYRLPVIMNEAEKNGTENEEKL